MQEEPGSCPTMTITITSTPARPCRPSHLRVRALESLLVEKGYVDPAALDALIETYEHKIGPRNGAAVVAKSWVDPEFRNWLMTDATAAIASLGFTGRQGEHMVAVANTSTTHNLVVCTLCSCYPWPVLGRAAGLVQIAGLPLAGGDRSEGRAGRIRPRAG